MIVPFRRLFLALSVTTLLTLAVPAQALDKAPPVAAQVQPLRILNVGERTFDEAPALAVVLSAPLDGKKRHDASLTVTRGGQPVAGGWVLSRDRQVLYFPGAAPETAYAITIHAGLTAADGGALAAPSSHQVTTRPLPAVADFVTHGAVLPSRLTEGLPIRTVNTPEVTVEFLRVKDDHLAAFVNQFYANLGGSYEGGWYLDQMHTHTESVYTGRFVTKGKPNTRTVTHLPVESIPQLRRAGLYVAVMSEPNRFGQYKVSPFFVSDIGLHVRGNRQGMSVFTSSLESGAALAKITVSLLDKTGKVREEAVTDDQGHARLGRRPAEEDTLLARREGELALLSFKEPALDLSEFPVDAPPFQPVEVFIYGPRDLYRPGETMTFATLLRDPDGGPAPAQPLTITLVRPDGQKHASLPWQPTTLGYYQGQFTLPNDARTGLWQLEARHDPTAKDPLRSYEFHVEEFLPERMKLRLEGEETPVQPGEEVSLAVSGDYLFGAPAAGNRLTASLSRQREPHPVATLPDFFFGDTTQNQDLGQEDLEEAKLDENGKYTLAFTPVAEKPDSPVTVTLTARLFESGGRPVVRAVQRQAWPAMSLVGVRPLFQEEAPSGGPARFEVARVGDNGVLQASPRLDVTLIKEDRDYYWSYTEGEGWRHGFSQVNYPVHQQSLTLAAGAKGLLELPIDQGVYRLEITDPETGLVTRHGFATSWWREGGGEQAARPDRVTLTLDKPGYGPGETAKVKIVAPHAGQGVLMVESSDQVLWFQRIQVAKEGSTVEIPVAEGWKRHDLYVSALVFRPGAAREKITPRRAVGLLHLPLDREGRKLAVKLTAPERMEPERDLTVRVKVEGLNGEPAMVTVAAVDQGILSVTDFATPDAHDHFFSRLGFGPELHDLYGRVVEQLTGVKAEIRFGGDKALNRNRLPKSRITLVSPFSGAVPLDSDGEATITLPIPDFNGAVRVMALVFSKDRFGAAEQEVKVAAKVVAEAAMPRFLASGDRSLFTLDLTNLSGREQDLRLELTAAAPLMLGPVEQAVKLADGKRATVRFPLAALEQYGLGRVDLHLQGDGIDIKRNWELAVRPPYPETRRLDKGQVSPGGTWRTPAKLTEGLLEESIEGVLQLSDRPVINTRKLLRGLLDYPYGCLEQTSSRLFAQLLAEPERMQRLGLPAWSEEKRARAIQDGWNRLAGLQLASGGFALWDQQGSEEPWLTPLAADLLLEARDRGYALPPGMLERVLEGLGKKIKAGGMVLQGSFSENPRHLQFAASAHAAYVLSRVQMAPLGVLRTLHDRHREAAASGLPLIHLGLALQLQGDGERAAVAVAEGVAKIRDDQKYLGDYGSQVRDTALAIALLHRHHMAGGDKLVFRLEEELAMAGNYLSTQEQVALLLATVAMDQGQGRSWRGALTVVGGDEEPLEWTGPFQRLFAARELGVGITAANRSDFPLYARVDLAGFPRQAPAPRKDAIVLVKRVFDKNGKPMEQRPLKVGELVLVHIQVNVKQRMENLLIADLLPAGLEIENLNISQEGDEREIMLGDLDVTEAVAETPLKFQEYRDDRYVASLALEPERTGHLLYMARAVSPGKFVAPPVFAEEMYRPAWFGVGEEGGVVTVEE